LHYHPTPSFRIGENRLHFAQTASTNDLLWELVAKGAPMGTVVSADFQTAGKGQAGSAWFSEPGDNLLCSIYLHTHGIEAQAQFSLNMAVALGVYDFARMYLGQGVRLKWPNDLYYHERKIGGILIENTIQGQWLAESVVGVGINVNQPYFSSKLPLASSFSIVTGQYYKISELMPELFKKLEARLKALWQGEYSKQRHDYREVLLGRNQQRCFEYQGKLIYATIMDVDDQGRLILDGPMGNMSMNHKEIKFRFDVA
jgi:BirA family biotin operon repressor/biotin-[acetyl-CoA-carboxylase] ligase